MCKFLEVSESGYYAAMKRVKNNNDLIKYEQIKEIQQNNNNRYGYRRIQIELDKLGYHYNHKCILRIMKKYDLLSIIRRKRQYILPGLVNKTYDNILNQDFITMSINEKWVTNITVITTSEGKLYLSVIKDLYDGFIIAYNYSTSPSNKLTINTIKQAIKYINNTILHSDQGSQYTSYLYQKYVKKHNIKQSMSRKGTPYDNAPMESFFSIFKTECIYLTKINTIKQAKQLCDDFIDYYNYNRIQLKHKACPYDVRKKFLNNLTI